MSDAHGVARDQLRAFIERIERLEEEKKTIADDIKDVYGEAKGTGFDTVIMKRVIALRKKDAQQRMEEEAVLDTYLHALGMIDQPDFFHETPAATNTAVGSGAGSAAPLRIQPETASETVGGFPVAAAPTSAEETGVDGRDAEKANGEAAGTAYGLPTNQPETATGETGMVLGTGRERPLSIGLHTDGDPEARFETVSLHQNSEIDPSEDRSEGQSLGGETVGANMGGDHVTDGRNAQPDQAGGLVQRPPAKSLRPHCLKPDACGGYGSNHCFSCKKSATAHEVAA